MLHDCKSMCRRKNNNIANLILIENYFSKIGYQISKNSHKLHKLGLKNEGKKRFQNMGPKLIFGGLTFISVLFVQCC